MLSSAGNIPPGKVLTGGRKTRSKKTRKSMKSKKSKRTRKH